MKKLRKSRWIVFLIGFFFLWLLLSASSCNKGSDNPNIPPVNINITIDPNSTLFYELNTVGGWCYLDDKSVVYIPFGSRGIIVYRMEMSTFLAYERTPPNNPNQCCTDSRSECTKLVVGNYYPFVKDTCTGTKYSILDGTIFEGEGQYPLFQYRAEYKNGLLFISN